MSAPPAARAVARAAINRVQPGHSRVSGLVVELARRIGPFVAAPILALLMAGVASAVEPLDPPEVGAKDGGVELTGPTIAATDPAAVKPEPSEPVAAPPLPIVEAEVVRRPVEPAAEIAEPVIEPAEPVVTPIAVEAEPVVATVEPLIEPVVTAVEPVVTAVEPAVATVEPVVEPVVAITTAADPTVARVESVIAPITAAADPVIETDDRVVKTVEQPPSPVTSGRRDSGGMLVVVDDPKPATGRNEPTNPPPATSTSIHAVPGAKSLGAPTPAARFLDRIADSGRVPDVVATIDTKYSAT